MISLRQDDWLGTIIGKRAFHGSLLVQSSDTLRFEESLPAEPSFIDIKIPTSDLETVRSLEVLGFRIIETALTFETRSVYTKLSGEKQITIREATPKDQNCVERIAAQSFYNSRFHQDKELKFSANNIKQQWAGNFFCGKRGSRMLVAEIDREVAGFLLLIDTHHQLTVIDLIATAEAYRGRGIASELIKHCKNGIDQSTSIKVGTQAHNIASVRLYESLGFRLVESHYVLHFHTSGVSS